MSEFKEFRCLKAMNATISLENRQYHTAIKR